MHEKDVEKAQRLNEVYKYLFAHHGVKSQKHLAEIIKVQRTGLSAAFNGSKANLTKNLFTKIVAAYPGVFNLDYLLTGEGTLLSAEEEVKGDEVVAAHEEPAQYVPAWIESLLSIISSQIKENEALVRELRQTTSEVAALRDTLAEITQKLNKNI